MNLLSKHPLAGVLLAIAITSPALAKDDHGGGGFERGDHGRHLGWYKHGGPAGPGPGDGTFLGIRPYEPIYGGEWIGRRAWGGGAYAWQSGVIAVGAAWGLAWGLGSTYAYIAPPVVYAPPPEYFYLPPVVETVPWMAAPAPYAWGAYSGGAVVAEAVVAPEALLAAALPPPAILLPPRDVMIASAPPLVIFSPPDYALQVWPVIAFAPPLLAFSVLHDDWWSTRYQGRGGYYAGGYYASEGYSNGYYAASAVRPGYYAPPLPFVGVSPGFGGGQGHGQGRGEGHDEGRGHGHGHKH